jgi:hypothetical protein
MPALTTVPHSPESIRGVIKQVHEITAAIQVVAETMDTDKIDSMPVDCQKSMMVSMESLRRWCSSLNVALTKELGRRGAFQAKSTGTVGTNPPRKTRKIRT